MRGPARSVRLVGGRIWTSGDQIDTRLERGLRALQLGLGGAHPRLGLGEALRRRSRLVEGEARLGAGQRRLSLGERRLERRGVDGGERLAGGHRLPGVDVDRGHPS